MASKLNIGKNKDLVPRGFLSVAGSLVMAWRPGCTTYEIDFDWFEEGADCDSHCIFELDEADGGGWVHWSAGEDGGAGSIQVRELPMPLWTGGWQWVSANWNEVQMKKFVLHGEMPRDSDPA